MIIDFHTHIYPDSMAAKIIAVLSKAADEQAVLDGTLDQLLMSMREADVDKSVILPVNTRPGQFDSITKFAKHINDTYDNLISFGGIHPDDENIADKLQYLKDNGFKGIKLHPDYTETFIDDERYIRIIAEAKKRGLLVITHAGKDPAYDIIHCTPQKGLAMLKRVQELVPSDQAFFVFAHFGGHPLLKEVEQYLVGQNCYLDISCSFADTGMYGAVTDEDFVRVTRKHGADKILFATDSPWNGQQEYINRLKAVKGLSDTEKDMILGKNAQRLLHCQ